MKTQRRELGPDVPPPPRLLQQPQQRPLLFSAILQISVDANKVIVMKSMESAVAQAMSQDAAKDTGQDSQALSITIAQEFDDNATNPPSPVAAHMRALSLEKIRQSPWLREYQPSEGIKGGLYDCSSLVHLRHEVDISVKGVDSFIFI